MFVSSSVLKIAKRGTSSAVIGTIRSTSDSATSALRARRGSCDIAKPAHEATSTDSGTASATTSSEFTV